LSLKICLQKIRQYGGLEIKNIKNSVVGLAGLGSFRAVVVVHLKLLFTILNLINYNVKLF